jgi:hypothetical protein
MVRDERADTLHEVTEVAVIRHRDLGVLLLHSDDRRWHFPDHTVRVGETWDMGLRDAVRSATGIPDLTIGPVLLIQNFGHGEVDPLPQFGLFLLCATRADETVIHVPHRWVAHPNELEGLDLFHPLVADLVRGALAEPLP